MSVLKFILNSGESSPGGALAPVLAPFGLDLLQVSKEVNACTLSKFAKGVPVTVKILLSSNKQVKVVVGMPTFTFYLSNLTANFTSPVLITDFYRLVLLISRDRGQPVTAVVSTLLSSLSSFQVKPLIKF